MTLSHPVEIISQLGIKLALSTRVILSQAELVSISYPYYLTYYKRRVCR